MYHHVIRIRLTSGAVHYERWQDNHINPDYAENHYAEIYRQRSCSYPSECVCINVYQGEE